MAMVGWMGAGMELVFGKHAGQSQVVGRMSGDAGSFPECVGNTLMSPDRTTIQVRRNATRRLRFVVHAVGWLHSMVLHGRYSIVINSHLSNSTKSFNAQKLSEK